MINIPLSGAEALPWGFFVLQAARGSVQVPDWVLLAVPEVVGRKLGMDPDEVTDEDVDRALAALPDDPRESLERLLVLVEMDPPPVSARFRLADDAAVGSFRAAVHHMDLLHDAALMLRVDYGAEGFYACMESVSDERTWDARGAVAAMMYLLILLGDA